MDEAFDAYNVERLRSAETLLLGRTTKDILVFGSHTMWNDLLAHGLVDELHLMIGPVVLGAGVPAFSGQMHVSLRRIDTPRTWDGSENILVRYEVKSL